MKGLLIFFCICLSISGWAQSIKGIYSITPLKGVGDESELSERAKTPMYFSYLYSDKVSLQQMQSANLKSVDTTYGEMKGEMFLKIDTLIRPSRVTVYKDFKRNLYRLELDQNREKVSLEDNIPIYEWKLEKGSKIIAGYSCKKAIATTTRLGRKQKLVAWYCEEIPVDDGLSDYSGLPGLILQVKVDDLTKLSFEKILLSPNENLDIPKPPKNPGSISISEYEKMMGNR